MSHATSAGFNLFAQRVVDYDMNNNIINGVFYSPENIVGMELIADIYLDRTSIEVNTLRTEQFIIYPGRMV